MTKVKSCNSWEDCPAPDSCIAAGQCREWRPQGSVEWVKQTANDPVILKAFDQAFLKHGVVTRDQRAMVLFDLCRAIAVVPGEPRMSPQCSCSRAGFPGSCANCDADFAPLKFWRDRALELENQLVARQNVEGIEP